MIPPGKPENKMPYLVYTNTGWDVHSYQEAFVDRLGYRPEEVFKFNNQVWMGPCYDPLPINFFTDIPADTQPCMVGDAALPALYYVYATGGVRIVCLHRRTN